jgi:DNA-binding transcriptional ArsR family regulator
MPLHGIEATDEISGLIRLRTSLIYEMIVSLQTLLQARRHVEWAAGARRALPATFWEALEVVYKPFHNGRDFIELAVDYPDHDDVPGFIQYVRAMDEATFVFYLLGRVIPREQLAETDLSAENLSNLLETMPGYHQYYCANILIQQLSEDVAAFQDQLADIWQVYWDRLFNKQAPQLRPHWESGLIDKEDIMARKGGQALLDHLLGNKKFPPPLPPDHPVTEISVIPVFLTSSPIIMFYGYGNVTILFDSERTEARLAQIEQATEEMLCALKALSDGTRLKVLRLVALHEGDINGKAIAEKLSLSASAVSRHLAQLRESGLISEETIDNRLVAYRLQKETITALPEKLLDYLYS